LQKSANLPIFTPKKSPQRSIFLWIIHGLALISSFTHQLPTHYYPLLTPLIVLCSGFFYLFKNKSTQPYTLSYQATSQTWTLHQPSHHSQTLRILPTTRLTSFIIILHSRLANGKRKNFIIMRDSLSEQKYRALLVLLKISTFSQTHKQGS
jgi:hypothetical protein